MPCNAPFITLYNCWHGPSYETCSHCSIPSMQHAGIAWSVQSLFRKKRMDASALTLHLEVEMPLESTTSKHSNPHRISARGRSHWFPSFQYLGLFPGGKNNNGMVTVVLWFLWFLCKSMGIYQNLYWIWIKLCFSRLLTQRCARRSCIAQKHWRGHFSFESPAHPQIKCNTGASHCADILFYIV